MFIPLLHKPHNGFSFFFPKLILCNTLLWQKEKKSFLLFWSNICCGFNVVILSQQIWSEKFIILFLLFLKIIDGFSFFFCIKDIFQFFVILSWKCKASFHIFNLISFLTLYLLYPCHCHFDTDQ
jgi:hypothetical protein